MASKYSSTVFVTFLLMLSLANASPIFSILQLPAMLGNAITNQLMFLNKIPIISQIIGGPATTTIAPNVYAPPPSSSSQATTAGVGATGTSPSIVAQPSVGVGPTAPLSQAPSTGSSTAAAESPAGNINSGGGVEGSATTGGATGTLPGIVAQPSVGPTAPLSQAPSTGSSTAAADSFASTGAAALQTPGGLAEAAISGDVSATGSSTAAADSFASTGAAALQTPGGLAEAAISGVVSATGSSTAAAQRPTEDTNSGA